MVTGEVTLRTPAGERTLRAGDVVCFPPGRRRRAPVRNDGAETVRIAMPSTIPQGADACVYPDSGKVKVSGRGSSADCARPDRAYWEGER